MALDETGLSIDTLQEIKSDLEESLQTELGISLNFDESGVIGIINAIFATAISDAYEYIQAVYDQRRLESAEGTNLDDLAFYTGLSRISADYSYTESAHFTGDDGTSIPAESYVQNPSTEDSFYILSEVTITTSSCYSATFSINTVSDSTSYTITVGNSDYVYTSGTSATESEILTGIETLFASSVGYTVAVDGETIVFTSDDVDSTLSISVPTTMTVEEVTSLGTLIAEETGAISAGANTITEISSPVSGWTSVTNPETLTIGRDRETDEELLDRILSNTSSTTAGTPDAILAGLRNLDDVTNAFIYENDTNFVDDDLRPAKSFEVVVQGGDNDEVAQQIWNSRPAGIELFGTSSGEAEDIDGNVKIVNFSRPESIYIHVNVEYTLFDEEIESDDLNTLIKEAILETAEDLDISDDVIPKRFYGNIYANTSGIGDMTISMAYTANSTDTATGYSEDRITVSFKQIADFSEDRIIVVEV